jgi:hypothetical protein
VEPHASRVEVLKRHLFKCTHVSQETRDQYYDELGTYKNGHSRKKQKVEQGSKVVAKLNLGDETTKDFHEDLCALFIGLDLAWNAADNPVFRNFFEKWLGHLRLPSRRALSSSLVDRLAKKTEENKKVSLKGKMGMGQCDGWKNVARSSIVASLVIVENQVCPSLIALLVLICIKSYPLPVHEVTAELKTANNLLNIVLSDMKKFRELGVDVIGWVSDAGGDSRAMRLRLSEMMPDLVVLDCWAHQVRISWIQDLYTDMCFKVNLIVGDYFKAKTSYVEMIKAAIELVKWFINRGYAHAKLKKEQENAKKKPLSLILPCRTRWTSQYLSINRLLTLKESMEATVACHERDLLGVAGKSRKEKDAARRLFRFVGDPNFWSTLEE